MQDEEQKGVRGQNNEGIACLIYCGLVWSGCLGPQGLSSVGHSMDMDMDMDILGAIRFSVHGRTWPHRMAGV